MSHPTFLQIHTLTSYPGTLLNRDDAGFAKRLPFGGSTRTRVSSQCLKYHWRNFDGEHALYHMDVPESVRSRETFSRKVAQPLIEDGYPESLVRGVTFALKERLLADNKANKNDMKSIIDPDDEEEAWEQLQSNQLTIFGVPELRYIRELASNKMDEVKETYPEFGENGQPDSDTLGEVADLLRDFSSSELKKNLKGMRLASGLDASLFGRMATSDVLARGDAAVHVAHALTTHEEESESDYFSAVDELRRDEPEESGEMGAGHINSSELTSGLFYGYVVVDLPLLVSNLEGIEQDRWTEADHTLASKVVERLVQLIATVSPGAKLGSTAPHAYAQCLLAESGTSQPRTLANAFQHAVSQNGEGILTNSYDAMADHLKELDNMYGRQTKRRLAALHPTDNLLEATDVDQTDSVPDIAEWAGNQLGGQ